MHLLKMVIRGSIKKDASALSILLHGGNVSLKRELQERCTWKIIYYMPK
jgi:hypothetical protein